MTDQFLLKLWLQFTTGVLHVGRFGSVDSAQLGVCMQLRVQAFWFHCSFHLISVQVTNWATK
jgi:hypothetical protein